MTPAWIAASALAWPVPRVSWKCTPSGHAGAGPADGVEQLDDAQRGRRADRVAQAQLVGPGGHGGAGDVDRAGDRRAAVERAVPGGGDDDLERAARAVGQAGDLADRGDGLGGRSARRSRGCARPRPRRRTPGGRCRRRPRARRRAGWRPAPTSARRPSGTARRPPGRRRRARARPSARRRTSPRSGARRWRRAPRASPAWRPAAPAPPAAGRRACPTSRTSTAAGSTRSNSYTVPPRLP